MAVATGCTQLNLNTVTGISMAMVVGVDTALATDEMMIMALAGAKIPCVQH